MQLPGSEPELLEWVLSHRKMKNVPLSAASMLEALDVWLEDNGKAGAHPEAFKEDVEKVAAFMCHCCYSPSLLVVYNGPFARGYDLGYVLFVVGRLRSEPQTLVVQSFLLKLNDHAVDLGQSQPTRGLPPGVQSLYDFIQSGAACLVLKPRESEETSSDDEDDEEAKEEEYDLCLLSHRAYLHWQLGSKDVEYTLVNTHARAPGSVKRTP
ncbi:unnamed protein product, partial [Symbiodinium microadriaticum]